MKMAIFAAFFAFLTVTPTYGARLNLSDGYDAGLIRQAFNRQSQYDRIVLQCIMQEVGAYDGALDGDFGRKTLRGLLILNSVLGPTGATHWSMSHWQGIVPFLDEILSANGYPQLRSARANCQWE